MLLDLVVYHKQNAAINRIKEVRPLHAYQTVQSDPRKSSIAIFICEILNKAVKEEPYSAEIFEFLFESMKALDYSATGYENFHLMFLIKLSRFLGFGAHQPNEIIGPSAMSDEEEKLVAILLTCRYDTPVVMTQLQRRNVLDALIRFYTDHIDTLGEIKSVQILREVMS
jgi:DNA repair protein RecO (recombination protein O)